MDTNWISSAISMLERCETRLSNTAHGIDQYRFLEEIRFTVKEATAELTAINRAPVPVERPYVEHEDPIMLECYCRGDSGPCGWCLSECDDCQEENQSCTCSDGG